MPHLRLQHPSPPTHTINSTASTPSSPISVLGARPMIVQQQQHHRYNHSTSSSSSKRIMKSDHLENIPPLPETITASLSLSSTNSTTNHSDDDNRNDPKLREWVRSVPATTTTTVSTIPSSTADDPFYDDIFINDSFIEHDIAGTANITKTTACEQVFHDSNNDDHKPRWKLLQEKRLALCRQRVHLERRLFETSIQQEKQQLCNDTNSCRNTGSNGQDPPMKQYSIPQCHNENNKNGTTTTTAAATYNVMWSGAVDDSDGLPTGFGQMINHATGQVYEGHCKRGLRHGQGRNVWSSKTTTTRRHGQQQQQQQVYTGEWINNQRHGRGTHTWSDGRSVTGSWRDGHVHGRVFFTWPNGTTYDGDTVHGHREGRGTQTWGGGGGGSGTTGRVYTGQYKAGVAHGVGMLTESNHQSKYRGEFQYGSRHGYGTQLWHNKLYEGEWDNNKVHGRGSLLWRDTGANYTGEFRHGLYHGIGIYRDGKTQYVGQWSDGYKDGEGKASWSDGRSYEGSFYKNRRHGYGRMVYADFSLYIGGWEHGKRCGEGIGVNANGIVQHCGQWANDRLIDTFCNQDTTTSRITTDDSSVSYQHYSNRSHSVNSDAKTCAVDRSMDDSDSDVFNPILQLTLLEI